MTEDWSTSSDSAHSRLLALTGSAQLKFIQSLPLLEDVNAKEVAQLLFSAYARYQDAKTRTVVGKILVSLVQKDSSILDSLTQAIAKFSQIKGVAITGVMTILEWTNELVRVADESQAKSLIASQAVLLDKILSTETKRVRVVTSAIRTTRSAIVSAIKHNNAMTKVYLSTLLESKPANPVANAVLVSTLAGACTDLLPVVASAQPDFASETTSVYNLYIQCVLGSKAPLSSLYVSAFEPLFSDYATQESFDSLILPAIAKSMLRAPETVLVHIVPGLISSLSPLVDLSSGVESTLLTSFLSSFGSSKEITRESSAKTLKIALDHCYTDSTLDSIAEKIYTALKKVTNPDHKILYGKTLAQVKKTQSRSGKIAAALVPIALKEVNENSLQSLVDALFAHFIFQLTTEDEVDRSVTDSVIKGLSDKRGNVKKIWSCSAVSAVLQSHKVGAELPTKLAAFVDTVLPVLQKTFDEISANPSNAVQNKVVSSAFAYMALAHRVHQKEQVVASALSSKASGKPALFSTRIVNKLTVADDFLWAVEAAKALMPALNSATDEQKQGWALTVIYSCLNSPRNSDCQQGFITALRDMYYQNPLLIGSLVISTIAGLVDGTISEEAIDEQSSFSVIISALFSQAKDMVGEQNLPVVESQLAKIAVMCHDKRVRPNGGWINLMLRSSVDPGKIVSEHGDAIIKDILHWTSSEGPLNAAAFETAATICFINPDLMAPKLLKVISESVGSEISKYTKFEMKIWSTPEGEIAEEEEEGPKKVYAENKNTKEYKEKQWEESVRKQIASKRGASTTAASKKPAPKKTVSKEEQQILDQQATIRSEIESVRRALLRGLGIISALAKNAPITPNGISIWFYESLRLVQALLSTANANSLAGNQVVSAYFALLTNASDRFQQAKQYVAPSSIHAVYPAFKDRLEPRFVDPENILYTMVTSVLYRLKFISSQPLDSVSLACCLPLLLKVLQANGVGTNDEEGIEEQFLLVMDILTAHSEEFGDQNTPRSELINSLINLMEARPNKAKQAKECLFSLVQNVSVNLNKTELDGLLRGVVSGDAFVRNAVLEAIDSEIDLRELVTYSTEILLATRDDDNNNAELAGDIWAENNLQITVENVEDVTAGLFTYLGSEHITLRRAAARALATSSPLLTSKFDGLLSRLIDLYIEKARPPAPVFDKFGIEIKQDKKDNWFPRSGVALALKELAPFFKTPELVQAMFQFLINEAAALGDKHETVRAEMQDAGLAVITAHGLENVEALIPVFEEYLAKPDSETQDEISEATIILYGALARHLKSNDNARLITIVDRLVSTLDTPSEDVQVAISQGIAPLVPQLQGPQLQNYFSAILDKLFNGEKFAQRRGAAYGLAGLVKGAGISSLADYDIIRMLTEAVEDKKNVNKRQGAQFAFECLSQVLGKYFEPYVIELLPLILQCLGDTSTDVREATTYASRMIMRHTTRYGIKKLIPLAIENLDSTAWRAKKGSVELLGTMAYLDPRQLSSSLSTIIPEIVGVLNDTHKEVRNAANQSLKRFGDVIRNPEIKELVPILIKAVGDPTKYTEEALNGLLKTQFVHYIDAPSLAIVVHVLHRGLKDRSAGTKKKACQIVGNMAILTDAQDLIPYLDTLVNELQVAMVDPVPGTRATASRALGSLVEKLGEEQFPELIPQLLSVLREEHAEGDRLGSAQALSEVIFGLGIQKLEELLPTILKSCTSPKPWVRQGFMPLMIYLPNVFGASLSPYLSQIIPPILAGLADTADQVRDTSLKAGRLLVQKYSTKAVDLLLPELEHGLYDINYRIRLSSVELTGDLLYQVTGISSSGGDDQDAAISGQANKALIEVLGQERRDRVLASLFVCRSDTWGMVRTAAIEVWKSLVANTPRTVKEILPTLTEVIIRRLASSEEEHRTIGALALGELVRRVGSNALRDLLPTLEDGLQSNDSDARQGICIALCELVQSTPAEALAEYQKTVISIVQRTLVDPDPEVREAAAQAFDVLQETIGNAAVDQIMPDLIRLMQSGTGSQSENAFAALKEMMATKSEVVFPILIPTLLSPPIDEFKAGALASLATVAGTALYKRLTSIINAIVDALVTQSNNEKIGESLDTVLLSVTHDEGSHMLMQHLLSLAKHEDSMKRRITFEHMSTYFKQATLDYSIYVSDWVSLLISSLDEPDMDVVKAAWQALSALVSKLSKEEMEKLVKPARQALRMTTPKQDLPGFTLPKGPNCVLPIFLKGLMYGSSEEREQSALGIADVIERTSSDGLKPFVTQLTGPLIRVIGERFPSDVKAAILYTLNALLHKIPQFMKPFLPQLQRTFAKSLSDPTNEVLRSRAAKALGTLITLQARIDPLVTELISGIKASDDEGVITAMHDALSEIVTKAGKNLTDASKSSLIAFLSEQVGNTFEDKKLILLAKSMGGVIGVLDSSEAGKLIASLPGHENSKFALLTLNAVLKADKSGTLVNEAGANAAIVDYLIDRCAQENAFMSENGILGLGKYLLSHGESLDEETGDRIVDVLAECMNKTMSRSPDTRRLALVVVRTVGRLQYSTFVTPHLDKLVLPIFGCVRDTIIPVKLAAEKAYLQVFNLVDEEESAVTFDKWIEHAAASGIFTGHTNANIQRSVQDYTRRVAMRLAAAERDRISAGGDAEQVYSDRFEDEEEIWSVGTVDLDEE
ncbi:eIF-2-alpha kinase activator Gcn1p [Trichomonascus vanleenenianus]|uniref:Gcn1p n=1 Tax=Trichomonascus vanleenenianus TaxID=2268995 RepID=UPI003ECAE950